MKSYKIMSLFLALVTVVSFTTPAFAAEKTSNQISDMVSTQKIEDTDTYFLQIDTIGNATYYFERTNEFVVSIGIYDSLADCAIRYFSDEDTVYSSIIPLEDTESKLSISAERECKFEEIKNSILNGDLTLSSSAIQIIEPETQIIAEKVSDEEAIMSMLYGEGWPQTYTQKRIGSKTQNGVSALLNESLTYAVNEFDWSVIVAKTALSVLAARYSIPIKKLADAITVVLTADGVYETVRDIIASKYDVYAYINKGVYINSKSYYWAGRTVFWDALVGDIGVALNLHSDKQHSDFDDNNKILETGLYNYFYRDDYR